MIVNYPVGWDWSVTPRGFRFYYGSSNTSLNFNSVGNLVTHSSSGSGEWVGSAPTPGEWTVLEVYQKMDTVSKANGGQGEIKLWRDGVFMGSQDSHALYSDPTATLTKFLYHTYADSAPQDQTCYFGQVTWAFRGTSADQGYIDQTDSMSLDENGFPFIGTEVG